MRMLGLNDDGDSFEWSWCWDQMMRVLGLNDEAARVEK